MIYLFAWVAVGVCSAAIAAYKGRNIFLWLALGVLLGPLSLIAAGFVLSDAKDDPAAALAHRICPFCSNRLTPSAKMCKHCKRFV